jgi:hypothetical protein
MNLGYWPGGPSTNPIGKSSLTICRSGITRFLQKLVMESLSYVNQSRALLA